MYITHIEEPERVPCSKPAPTKYGLPSCDGCVGCATCTKAINVIVNGEVIKLSPDSCTEYRTQESQKREWDDMMGDDVWSYDDYAYYRNDDTE